MMKNSTPDSFFSSPSTISSAVVALVILLLFPFVTVSAQRTFSIFSPDSSICAEAYIAENRTIAIAVTVDGLPFMTIDSIGWGTDQGDICSFGMLERERDFKSNEATYRLLWGENKQLFDHYNGLVLLALDTLSSRHKVLRLTLYVANDGVAFQASGCLKAGRLHKEHTRYSWACDGTAWSIPANFASYEFLYRQQPLSQVDDANTPFTFHLENGLWGSIHEARLEHFPEMTLVRSDSLAFRTWLCPSAEREYGFSIELDTSRQFPISTDIRAITIGRSATDLCNSHFLLSLCGEGVSSIEKTDSLLLMCRPMKYIGIWWGMHLGVNSWTPDSRHGCTTANALRYIDFAAENNIDAVLLEGWNQGWENWGGSQRFDYLQAAPDVDIDSICRYAQRRGVEIIIHHETGGNWPEYEAQLDTLFRWCRARGIHAVKTGYAGGFPGGELHHSLVGVNHYNTVMQKAALYGIMLDVHEPVKPTGLCRVYPNLMTGEGVRGQEWNAWSEGNPPSHHTILPFTRGLAGPMDYTPGIFDITYQCIQGDTHVRQWNQMDARECRVHTTLAHQMALWVVLYSPWQMAADLIENYMTEAILDSMDGHEGLTSKRIHPMFRFFVDYDPDCDESRMLQGLPGQYVATMRRAGERYFLGAITNEQGRTITIPLDFLPSGRTFTATLYLDAPDAHYETNPTAWRIEQRQVSSQTLLSLPLSAGGGCAIVIEGSAE